MPTGMPCACAASGDASIAAGPVGAVVGSAVGGVIGGVEGLFGVRPVYAAYPEPRMDRHRQWVRHSYHHMHRRHTTG